MNGAAKTKARTMVLSERPRLYFSADDMPGLRQRREDGLSRRIWSNLIDSAEWCLTRPVRRAWIPPLPEDQDPVYERLYDRFYAIMHDLAVSEHLCFAGVLSEDARYLKGARRSALASARTWRREADGAPDGGKAYAVCRLIKALAVAVDLLDQVFTDAERAEVRDTLAELCGHYFDGYFTTDAVRGESFHAHHAIVEWASFGVAALSLLGHVADADDWLEATVQKFENHLLPMGVADDGAQVEGSTFWASTMQYRLFFMDALRRVTGHDLYAPFAPVMNARFALAGIAGRHRDERMASNRSVVLSPSYGQLDYVAPVLLKLAAEYRDPMLQHLATWDETLGGIQKTEYITPNAREQLLFELGGYAYVWHDPTVPDEATEPDRTYLFPSVGQAYAHEGWEPGGALVGLDALTLIVHGREAGLLMETHVGAWSSTESQQPVAVDLTADDDGNTARIDSHAADTGRLTMSVARPGRVHVQRRIDAPLTCWSHGPMGRNGNELIWPGRARGRVTCGTVTRFEPEGYHAPQIVGMGKLRLADDDPVHYPIVMISPEDGRIELDIRLDPSVAHSQEAGV